MPPVKPGRAPDGVKFDDGPYKPHQIENHARLAGGVVLFLKK